MEGKINDVNQALLEVLTNMTNFLLRELDRSGAKDKMNGGVSPSVSVSASASGLRQRRRGSAQADNSVASATLNSPMERENQQMLSPSDAEMRKEMGFLKQSMVEMLQRFGVMEQTLNDIDQRTGEMAVIQSDIQHDVKEIKRNIRNGFRVSSSECDAGRIMLDALIVGGVGTAVGYSTAGLISFLEGHALGLYASLGVSSLTKCIPHLTNVFFKVINKLFNIWNTSVKWVNASARNTLGEIPLIGSIVRLFVLFTTLKANMVFYKYMLFIIGISWQGINEILELVFSFVRFLFDQVYDILFTASGPLLDVLDSIFKGFFGDTFSNVLSQAWSDLGSNIGSWLWSGAKKGAKEAASGVTSGIKKATSGAASKAKEAIFTAGKNAYNKLPSANPANWFSASGGGIKPEINIDTRNFTKALKPYITRDTDLFKKLYLADCFEALVTISGVDFIVNLTDCVGKNWEVLSSGKPKSVVNRRYTITRVASRKPTRSRSKTIKASRMITRPEISRTKRKSSVPKSKARSKAMTRRSIVTKSMTRRTRMIND